MRFVSNIDRDFSILFFYPSEPHTYFRHILFLKHTFDENNVTSNGIKFKTSTVFC